MHLFEQLEDKIEGYDSVIRKYFVILYEFYCSTNLIINEVVSQFVLFSTTNESQQFIKRCTEATFFPNQSVHLPISSFYGFLINRFDKTSDNTSR